MGAESERRDSPLRRARTGGNGDADRPTDDQQHPATPNKRPSRLTPGAAVALQAKAGNRAVSRLVAQRRAATAPAAKAPAKSQPASAAQSTAAPSSAGQSAAGPVNGNAVAAPAVDAAMEVDVVGVARAVDAAVVDGPASVQRLREGPGSDPKFRALKQDVKSKQQTLGKHPPAKAEADAAAKAAKPPQDDRLAQGKAANAEKMNAAKPGEFDKAAFIAAVNAAIAKQAPKNLEEADEFGSSGKAEAVKGEVAGKVEGGKKASAGQIESTTKAPPDTAAATVKPVTPLKPDQPPGTPGTPDPGKAIPDKAPPEATDFSAGPKAVNDEMADAQVTEDQLAKSNEPEFTGALKEKKAGEVHSATAPGEVRGKEAQTLAGAKAQAQQAGATAMAGMGAVRGKSGKEVDAGKGGAQSEEEKKRAQVTATLQKVFDATKKDVEDILSGLDKKVDDKFTRDEKTARDAFTADHKRRMDAYKDKRYSGWTGGLKWAKDKLLGMPEEANQIFVVARQGYVTAMQGVISGVADLIGTELNAAKARIAKGRADLQAEVQKLPKDLQQLGKEAAGEFAGKFDELTESVDAKGSELVDTLASKYTEALKAVDEEIEAEKEKNKGLVAKAIDAVKGVIQTIMQLKDLLLGVLAKAAQAVMAIIKDPIGFLGNLISAVGAGLQGFIANIGAHLQKGLVSWLLGTAAKAGLQLPEKFDLKGILSLIASLLGLTWASIRGRIVAKGVPEQAMSAVESGVPLVQKLMAGGVGGLWEDLKEQIGDLKETLLGKITEYLVPTVLIAGITWIVSLLNPASAFIKACKAIIDIVTFIITRGAQILEFVNAILDAVIAIAGGGAGGVPGLIEAALAKSIPVLIGFLAALLGIGGIADKVKKIFQTLSKPVMKAVDTIVGKIVAYGKRIWAKLKAKAKAAFSWVMQKVKPKKVDKAFAMASGEPHTLTANASNSGLKVTIASAFAGEVRGVMAQLKAEVGNLSGADKVAAMTALSAIDSQLGEIAGAEQKWKSGKAAAEKTVQARVDRWVKSGKIKSKAEAEATSKQLLAEKEQKLYQPIEKMIGEQVNALRKLKSMKQFVDAPAVRRIPIGYDVRTRLYVLGSGWKAASTSWRNQKKQELVEKVRAALAGGHTPVARAKILVLAANFQLPDGAMDLFDSKKLTASHIESTKYEVDHTVPLAQHWVGDGHKLGDAERRAHCMNQSEWRLITESKNKSLQGGGAKFGQQRDLDKSFSSELADGGIPNAKRIDGRALLDQSERPIT